MDGHKIHKIKRSRQSVDGLKVEPVMFRHTVLHPDVIQSVTQPTAGLRLKINILVNK